MLLLLDVYYFSSPKVPPERAIKIAPTRTKSAVADWKIWAIAHIPSAKIKAIAKKRFHPFIDLQ
jgi:hypothetical protein